MVLDFVNLEHLNTKMDNSDKGLSGFFRRMQSVYNTLPPEKVLLVWVLLAATFILWGSILIIFNSRYVIEVPGLGGTISEGIVGTPRFINPVLANTPQDKDLAALIYAGLTRRDKDGNYVPDIAQTITASENGLSYNVVLKSWAKFHDGKPITADDVLYTIGLVQNPRIKSPHDFEWEGVSAEKISNTEILFTLKRPYPLFLERLSLGVIPKHVWQDLSEEQFSLSDYNIRPIGSGPFAIEEIKSVSGIPKVFTLRVHKNYTLGRPYLDNLIITSYESSKAVIQAFNKGEIDRFLAMSAGELALVKNLKNEDVLTARQPRAYAIFLNANSAQYLADKNVRLALSLAINREEIISTIYGGYAIPMYSPYAFDEVSVAIPQDLETAKELLSKTKAFKNATTSPTLTLITTNSDETRMAAEMIKKYWESIGVKTNVQVYEASDVTQSIIKERDFESLLYASLVGHPSDLYAFWHSSQRTYPGVNISGYVSAKLDKALEILRLSLDTKERSLAYEQMAKEFKEETPGIYLYNPTLIYVTRGKAKTELPGTLIENSERFALVNLWYKNKEMVWKGTYIQSAVKKLQGILH